MALSTRQRWMLYGLAALLTGAAMLAVQPDDDAADAVVAPATRPARAAVSRTPGLPTADIPTTLALPQRPYGGAGRRLAATAPPFAFLGRWTENGVTTVFLSHGARQLAAVAGRPLTSDYLVEHIGERELRLVHVPTGTRHALALVAGRPGAAAAVPGPAPSAADTEEQN